MLLCFVSLARPAAFRPHRIAGEAGRLAKHTGAKTLSSAGMQAACRLQGAQGTRSRAPFLPGSDPSAPRPEVPQLPGELAKHAMSEGAKAVARAAA